MVIEKTKGLHAQMFEIDLRRRALAHRGDLLELEKTYDGSFPEIEISTSDKWDDLAGMSSVPDIRIRRLARAAELIGEKNVKILDIGPGWGDIIPILEKNRPDLNYTGIDFSANVIDLLSQKYGGRRFICGSIDELREERFDTVLVLEVLEHIVPSQVLGFLRKIRELLSTKGRLVITIPVDEDLEEFTFTCGNCGHAMNKMGHVRIYSKELVMAELALAGFNVIHQERMYVGYYGAVGAVKRRLRNTLGRLIGPAGFKSAKAACLILVCEKGAA